MIQEEMDKARAYTQMGNVPPWGYLKGAMNPVSKGAEELFQTKLKRDLFKAIHYFWLNSGRFGGGGWSNDVSLRPDIVIGAADYSDDTPIEEALKGEQPKLETLLERPVISFSGYSMRNIGSDMQHYLKIQPISKVKPNLESLNRFLSEGEKEKAVFIVPDQYDKEVFAFVIPQPNGYTIIRLREHMSEEK